MKILIVDDNKNNRMILRLLLEDYMDENEGISFNIDEAQDGKIAVDMCRKTSYDIVLMDIMMPNMDGMEATKIIHAENKKIMIIAVSAVDDSERKKLILNYGAEDYISKPVNADIFISRIANYMALVETRKTKQLTSHSHTNLFTNKVFNRHTRFMLTSEDAISEFWEYFLLVDEIKSDGLSDVIRSIVSIAEIQRRLHIDSDIFVEESENSKYFTLTNLENVPSKIIELTLKKNSYSGLYKIANGKISFELEIIYSDMDELYNITHPVEESVKPEAVVEEEKELEQEVDILASTELKVFNFMDSDDLLDLEEFSGKLASIMLLVGGGGINEEEVYEVASYLDKISSILSAYNEVYEISNALTELSSDMTSHVGEFIENSDALGPMCKAFSNDMTKWIQQTFYTGAPSIDFMNDTIVVNSQTIGSMLKMNDAAPAGGDDDFDDIFDF